MKKHAGKKFSKVKNMSKQDYSSADMVGCDFFGKIEDCLFRFTDFANSDMSRVKFTDCIFAFSDFLEADCYQAQFRNCEFIGCNMRETKFLDAMFEECTLNGCIAFSANFADVVMEKTKISGVFTDSRWDGAVLRDVQKGKLMLQGASGWPG